MKRRSWRRKRASLRLVEYSDGLKENLFFSPFQRRGGNENDDEEEEEGIEEIAEEVLSSPLSYLLLHLTRQMFKDKVHYVTTSMDVAKRLRAAGHIPVVDGIIPGTTGTN